jgi:hypothetical protein
VSDAVQRVNEALVAIVNADATIRTLTGRTSGNLVPWSQAGTGTLPTTAYQLVVDSPVGDGQVRRMQYQLDAFADGNGAGATVNALADALIEGISVTALATQGLDAVVETITRRVLPPDPEGGRALQRATLDLTLTLFA